MAKHLVVPQSLCSQKGAGSALDAERNPVPIGAGVPVEAHRKHYRRFAQTTPFGLLRVFSVVIPFLYVGTQISKNFAALLEEHDIFVPEDDDDDD
uniref:Essential MCU regulator, mitochondrial n=1 Tax=Phasianus colchicus TaxID=9054 RepID=A0A669QKV0_PHACC